jgi:hypothetical protein
LKVFDTLPALAVSVTICEVVTAVTVAEKLPVLEPEATVTDAGTVTNALLLLRFTANPPLTAAVFSVTVQASVPAALIDEFAQESPVNTGTPVPVRPITVEAPDEELLASVNCPVFAPAVDGLNCTVNVAV